MNAFTSTPQGPVVSLTPPNLQDYPRLVFTAPYFVPVAMAELFEPSVQEAVEGMLPTLLPPYVDAAALAAVQQNAVMLAGSAMTGPLLLFPTIPTADTMAATKAYVDMMAATGGIPEVPPVPVGQIWARQTAQWVPISLTGDSLPIIGGTMQGPINMSGNAITGLPAVPTGPSAATSMQWVLNQLAATSLYQGVYNAITNVPDLTQPGTHQNAFTWICNTAAPSGTVVTAAIPGLQGTTLFVGDTIIFSAFTGQFQSIHAGGLTLPEADARYLQLTGGQLEGPLLLNEAPTQPMEAATMAWVESLISSAGIPEAPNDGQNYLRDGATASWRPGLPVAGGAMTGPLLLAAAATQQLQAVTLSQISALTGAQPWGYVFAGPVSGVPALPAFRLLQPTDLPVGYSPVSIANGGTGRGSFPPVPGVLVYDPSVAAPNTIYNQTVLALSMGGTGQTAFATNGLLGVSGAPGAPVIGVTSALTIPAGSGPALTITQPNPTIAGIQLSSGGPGYTMYGVGRGAGTDGSFGVIGTTGQFLNTGGVPGDVVVQATAGTLWLSSVVPQINAVNVQMPSSTVSYFNIQDDTGTEILSVGTGYNNIYVKGAGTTAAAANAFINAAAAQQLQFSVSARRFKAAIETVSPAAAAAIIDRIKPITYTSLCPDDDPHQRHYGLIAEDVAEIAPELVTRDAKQQPNYVQYDRFIPLLVAEIQSLRQRLAAAGVA